VAGVGEEGGEGSWIYDMSYRCYALTNERVDLQVALRSPWLPEVENSNIQGVAIG